MPDSSLLMFARCVSVAYKTPFAVNRFSVPDAGTTTVTSQASAAVTTAAQSILLVGTLRPNVVSVR